MSGIFRKELRGGKGCVKKYKLALMNTDLDEKNSRKVHANSQTQRKGMVLSRHSVIRYLLKESVRTRMAGAQNLSYRNSI